MIDIEAAIGYEFKDKALLKTAFTHTSYSNENQGASSNERLEFLGDSVLGFIAAKELYKSHPGRSEGELTRLRAAYVCEESLCEAAIALGLNEALSVGRGEALTGGRKRASMTADAFEALLAALYLDGGLKQAERFVKNFLLSRTPPASAEDFKTALQERTQRGGGSAPLYTVTGESGPDHQKTFTVEASLEGILLGIGRGGNKKQAEQEAARQALETLGANQQ